MQPPLRAAEYAAPATPAFENVVESPGYTVPEDSGLAWIQGFAPVSETVLDEEGGHWLSLKDPPPRPVPASAATPVVVPITEGPAVPTMPPTSDDTRFKPGTRGVRQVDRAQVFRVESTAGSTSSPLYQAMEDISPDLTREGPFDASEVIPEPGQSPLVLNSMPEYWLEHMGRDRAVAAALRLHHDASFIMTNVQVMSQFVTSLNRTASEVMRTAYDMEPFPTDAVNFVTPGRRVRRAAHYMAAMACGALPVLQCFRDPSRCLHATLAWHVMTVFRTLRSKEHTTSRPSRDVYIQTLDIVGSDIPCCSYVV